MIGFFHADIDNGLSQVALAWMVGQAKAAGVKMDESPITVPASAVLHDKSNNILTGAPVDTCALCTLGEDRRVNGAASGSTQRTMGFGAGSNSMTYADTQDPANHFITYRDRDTLARYADGKFKGDIDTDITGDVNVDGYVAWLKLNGYALDDLKVTR